MKKSKAAAVAVTAIIMAVSLCACDDQTTADESTLTSLLAIDETDTKQKSETIKTSKTKTQTETTEKPSVSVLERLQNALPAMNFAEKNYIIGDNGLLVTTEFDDRYVGRTFAFNADGGKISTGDIIPYWYDYIEYSFDNKKAAFMQSIGNKLYYISSEDMKPVLIDSNVEYFSMSLSGESIVYSCGPSYLYLWDGLESRRLADRYDEGDKAYISPDGQTVFHQSRVTVHSSFLLYTDGESTTVDDNIYPFAVSDDGTAAYYQINTYEIYVRNKNDDRVLLYDSDTIKEYFIYSFNSDMTEFMFAVDGKLYISKNGESPKCILEDLKGDYILELPHLFPDKIAVCDGSDRAYGVDSFAGTFYADRNLYYIDENFTMHTVIEDITYDESGRKIKNNISGSGKEMNRNISSDGKIITFLKDDIIYRYDIHKGEITAPFDTGEDIQFYFPTESGDAVYYFDKNKCLYYAKSGGEKTLLMDELGDFASNKKAFAFDAVCIDGEKIYFLNEGVVWCCDGMTTTQMSADEDFFVGIEFYGGLFSLTGTDEGDYVTGNAVMTRDGTITKTFEYD